VCDRMMPGLERLAREMEDVAFLYVDVSIVRNSLNILLKTKASEMEDVALLFVDVSIVRNSLMNYI
jgi:hypothetical protein